MAAFIAGLVLARGFYTDVLEPLMKVPHTACLLGEGSEVLGYDSQRSTDHEWGPRVQLLVRAEDVEQVRAAVANGLPEHYEGYPTAWYSLIHQAVTHHIEITTFGTWIVERLGVDPRPGLDHATWLGLPQQRLLQLTRGAVFRDDPGDLNRVRRQLAWYPTDVWRWLLASQWRLIGNTQPLLGRVLETGDQRGARLLVAKLCRLIMEMALLQEHRYRPYDKWLGTAFAESQAATTLGPLLDTAMKHEPTCGADSPLTQALITLGHRHTALAISDPITPSISDFQVNINDAIRPYPVLNTPDFVTKTIAAITDSALRALVPIGGIDQLTHADDALINFTPWPEHLVQTYRTLLHE